MTMSLLTTQSAPVQLKLENLSSRVDMQTHANPAIQLADIFTDFSVDRSSRFPLTAWKYTQTHKVTDATDHPTHGPAADVGK